MAAINSYILNGVLVVEHSQEEEIASDQTKASRLAICSTCDRKQGDGCQECSCLLITRTAYKESFCPIGKW